VGSGISGPDALHNATDVPNFDTGGDEMPQKLVRRRVQY